MNIELADTEIIYIYGRMLKEVNTLKEMNSNSNIKLAKESYEDQIATPNSIVKKLLEAYPQLASLPIE